MNDELTGGWRVLVKLLVIAIELGLVFWGWNHLVLDLATKPRPITMWEAALLLLFVRAFFPAYERLRQ